MALPIEHVQSLLLGAWGTLLLSALTFLVGGLVGLAVALARVSPRYAVRTAVAASTIAST